MPDPRPPGSDGGAGMDGDGGGGMDMAMAPGPGDGRVVNAVAQVLENLAPLFREKTWSVSTGNLLAADWLIQSPPKEHFGKGIADLAMPASCSGAGCDADFGLRLCSSQADCTQGGRCMEVRASVSAPMQAPKKMCVGHSDHVYERFYDVLVSADKIADVTSLLPPDGRFESAMRNAVTYLAKAGKTTQIRFLFGCYPFPGGGVDSKKVLTSLTRDLPQTSKVHVYVGNYRSSNTPPSWNHSKIVAADGRVALVGGHNLWDAHYLRKDPVHDVSMSLSGPAAGHAHVFANQQWSYTCATRSALYCATGSVCSHHYTAGKIDEECAPQVSAAQFSTTKPGDTRVIGMGRLALIDPSNQSNQSDLAFTAMLGAAKKVIRISQQDIGPPTVPILGIPAGKWPDPLFGQIGSAIVRGVDVYIVVSNKDAVAGGLSATEAPYSNGWTAADVALRIRDYIEKNPPNGAPTGAALRELLCKRLFVAPLRFSSEDTFPGGMPYGNHAKLVVVDDQAFYIGSQNQYDAGLTEYGFLVDDERASAVLVKDYFAPLWTHSQRKAVSGEGITPCVLR